MFLYLVFIEFASFMLAISFMVIFAKSSQWVFYTFLQLFSFIILVALIWQAVYIIGFRDSNMVRTGHQTEDLYKGFKIGAIAQIPGFVLFVSAVAFNMRFSLYRLLTGVYWTFLTAIAGTFNADKISNIYMREMGVLKIGGMALLFLIIPALSGVFYILGYKGIDLFTKFVYKKRK